MCKERMKQIYQSDKFRILACECSYRMQKATDKGWAKIRGSSVEENDLYMDLVSHVNALTQSVEESKDPPISKYGFYGDPVSIIVEQLSRLQGIEV